jgi:Ca-activated chloride channel family protein
VALVALLPSSAAASVQDAQKAYAAGRFEDAAREYGAEQARHPKDARLAVDAAVASYRAGHYETAEAALEKALPLADPKLQQRVLYDVGDARYRLGATTLNDAPEKTIERWKAAVAAYSGALELAPADADARFNRDLVERKLAELEKKQREQPKEQPKNNPSSKDSKGQDSKKDPPGQNGGSSDTTSGGASSSKATKPNGASGESGSQGPTSSGGTQGGASPGAQRPDAAGNTDHGGTGQRGGQKTANQTEPGKADEVAGEGATGGRLSRRDARALLQSLRGEERRGVSFGTSAAPPTGDSPVKDW